MSNTYGEKYFLTKRQRWACSQDPIIVVNYYVYIWLDNGVPFYVGMGSNNRAWEKQHNNSVEKKRRESKNFDILIYEHNLTQKDANRLVKKLIYHYRNFIEKS